MCWYGFAHWSVLCDIDVGGSGIKDGIIVIILCMFVIVRAVWTRVGVGIMVHVNIYFCSIVFLHTQSSAPPHPMLVLWRAFMDPLQEFSFMAWNTLPGFGLGHVALVCQSGTLCLHVQQ
jgi:hypothetical protein